MPPTSGVVWSGVSVVIAISPPSTGGGRFGRRSRGPHLRGRLLDRLDDVHVTGAAAEVPADPLPDLVVRRVRLLFQQPGRLHDHARRTEPALHAVLIPERLLQ